MHQAPEQEDLLKTILSIGMNGRFWKGIFVILKPLFLIVFWLPLEVVDHLMHTGRGINIYTFIPFILTSVFLFVISKALQNTAGDAVFLLWAVYTLKWIAEYIWAQFRQWSPQSDHGDHPGFMALSPLGIESKTVTFLITTTLGLVFLIAFPETGWAVGLLFLIGSIGAMLTYWVAGIQNRSERIQARDGFVTAEINAKRESGEQDNQEFWTVDIE
tara:strand:+ start:4491 stop:5138 length:648 start_codon:yes stop_codon:yes gene_type:complete